MADTKWSQFPSATPGNFDEVVGLRSGDNARFSIANIVAAVRNGLASIFVPLTRTINGKALSTDISLDSSDVGAVATSAVGAVNGVASLDSNGKVPGTQLDLSGKQSTITASGILKGDGQGGVSAATAGTDYQAPLTAGTDYATPAQLADKAAKADLTNIQATGTTNTTGAAITAGTYFYLNGMLVQAIGSGIASGASFTLNTNYKTVTAGGLNDLKNWTTIDVTTLTKINTNITINGGELKYNKALGLAFISLQFTKSTNGLSGVQVVYLPEDVRPTVQCSLAGYNYPSKATYSPSIRTNANTQWIQFWANASQDAYAAGELMQIMGNWFI